MDVHRNNAFSSVAMEVAFNEGEEWLEQLLAYLDGNFTFIREYCSANIPKNQAHGAGRHLSCVAGLP